MEITLSGMVTLARLLHNSNALSPIAVISVPLICLGIAAAVTSGSQSVMVPVFMSK